MLILSRLSSDGLPVYVSPMKDPDGGLVEKRKYARRVTRDDSNKPHSRNLLFIISLKRAPHEAINL